MISFEELKADRELIRKIDWNLTPQEAFEAYQIKTAEGWRYRSLPDVHYISIIVYKEKYQVLLVKRSLKDSEEIAELPVPEELVKACLDDQAGYPAPQGQYAIDKPIADWVREQFGA